MKYRLLLILLMLTNSLVSHAIADDAVDTETVSQQPKLQPDLQPNLQIEQAWIAEAPPVSRVMVAYMTFINDSDSAITITHAESDLYSSIEFHETVHEGGMAKMIRHDYLTIPANGKLELKRGGPHLMLFNPRQRLHAGDVVTIKLTSGDNTVSTISVPVKKAHY